MKKFLSIVLSVALVLSLFGMNVLAAKEQPVGKWGEKGTIEDGVTNFDREDITADVTVNFNVSDPANPNGVIEERYAIDIEYQDLIIDLTDIPTEYYDEDDKKIVSLKYVWDVNTYQYVEQTTSVDAAENSGGLPTSSQIVYETFNVINHSSLPIWYKAASTIESGVSDNALNVAFSNDGVAIKVNRATTGGVSNGYHTMTVNPKTNWLNSLNWLKDNGKTSGSTVGTITVTVAMTENALTTP